MSRLIRVSLSCGLHVKTVIRVSAGSLCYVVYVCRPDQGLCYVVYVCRPDQGLDQD